MEVEMNWDQVAGNWKQLKGVAKEKWGRLTDDDLEMMAGQRDQLIGRLQEHYGMAREEEEKEAERRATSIKRSGERRAGKAGDSKRRCRWSPADKKQTGKKNILITHSDQ